MLESEGEGSSVLGGLVSLPNWCGRVLTHLVHRRIQGPLGAELRNVFRVWVKRRVCPTSAVGERAFGKRMTFRETKMKESFLRVQLYFRQS